MERLNGWLDDGTACSVEIEPDGRVRAVADYTDEPPALWLGGREIPHEIVVNLNDGRVATLRNVFFLHRKGWFGASQTTYGSQLAFIGKSKFTDRINRVAILPSQPEQSIFYRGHKSYGERENDLDTLAEILRNEPGSGRYLVSVIDSERLVAAKVVTDFGKIEFDVAVSRNMSGHGTELVEQRRALLEYNEPHDAPAVIEDVVTLCDFLSINLGEVIVPTKLQVVSDGERDRFGQAPLYEVYVRLREPGEEIAKGKVYRLLSAPSLNREHWEHNVARWFERRSEWRQSYSLFISLLGRQREFSRERFMDAIGWFESIPEFYMPTLAPLATKAALKAATSAAAEALKEKGSEIPPDRIRNLFGMVNDPSLSTRLTAALERVRSTFGDEILPAGIETYLRLAPKIRGNFAHGENAFIGSDGDNVYPAMVATEAVCLLLTLDGLFIRDVGKNRTGHILDRSLEELQSICGGK